MQKRIKVWLELSPLILSICLTIGIVFLSLVNLGKTLPVGFFNIDKLYHFVAYFVLAFSWCLSLQKNELNVKFMLWIGIAVILRGREGAGKVFFAASLAPYSARTSHKHRKPVSLQT